MILRRSPTRLVLHLFQHDLITIICNFINFPTIPDDMLPVLITRNMRQLPFLLHLRHGLFCQRLSQHPFHNFLFPRLAVANANDDPCCNIAADGAAEDCGSERARSDVVANRPCACAKCDLKEGMAVEETNDSNEETERERVVRCSRMRFVESV